MRLKRFIYSLVAGVLVAVLLAAPVFGQVHKPDGTFNIQAVEVYRHVLEEGDALFGITGTVEYTTTPTELVSRTYLVRLMDGADELGVTTFYAYHDNGYDYGVCSIYFTATEVLSIPVEWDPVIPYTMELRGNPAVWWLDTTATTAMDGAVADDGGSQTDETVESNSAAANDMTLMPAAPAVDDAYYFGSDGLFDDLRINLGTSGDWAGTYTWEYWDGDEWVAVSGLSDGTIGFTEPAGTYDVTFTCPTDWQTIVVSGLDLYWFRFRVVTYSSIVTQPLGTQSWTNSLGTPSSVTNDTFNWIDEGTVAGAQARLTIRLRSLAQLIENDWGGATNLIELVAGVNKLTDEGEEYFVNSIDNLRVMCPDLFADVITTPEFPDRLLIGDYNMGGEDEDYDIYGANLIYAQTFAASSSYSINGFEAKLSRTGSPGDIIGSVRATAGGLPTGANLVAGTLDDDEVITDADGGWYIISFTSDYALTDGAVYALVISVTGGNVNNYVEWFDASAGSYADGQSCFYNGAVWAAVAGKDFMFSTRGTDAQSMSYRNRLANQLVGTRFDMTNLGLRVFGGLSRMWTSTMVWIIIACALPSIFVCRAANSLKPSAFLFALMIPFGALLGFIYLEIAALVGFSCAFLCVFLLVWQPSSS